MTQIKLIPLQEEDREQFIKDNQAAFNYGAEQYFNEQELKEQYEEENDRNRRTRQKPF